MATVKRHLSGLQGLFSDDAEDLPDAAGHRIILSNPFEKKGRLLRGLIDDPSDGDPVEAGYADPYSREETDELLAYLERHDLSDQVKVLLALGSGLRRSEVLAVHAADLDLDAAWGRVRRALSRAELRTWKTRQARRRPSPLGPDDRGRASSARAADFEYEGEDRFDARFLLHLEAASVVAGERPFHRLRHTFCARLLEVGVEPFRVSKWAGHASIEFTQRAYAEWIPGDEHREEINRAVRSAQLGTPWAQPARDREGVPVDSDGEGE